MKPTPVLRTVAGGGIALVLLAGLSACGGSGGGDATAVSGGLPEFNGKCAPGIVRGFTGGFDDTPVRVIQTGDSDGGSGGGGGGGGDGAGAGAGGDGAGAPGIGVGGALGQLVNVDVTAEFASGERFGPVRVDDAKGMVTVVPCGLKPPVLVSYTGAAGSGARYYDEALGHDVSFEGQRIRSVITAFDKNAGVTSFTEAMLQRTERLAVVGGISAADAWKDLGRVETAHSQVRQAVNDLLPGSLRIDDLRRLPVILNQKSFASGAAVLADNQHGRYGAALAGFAQTGGTNLGNVPAPALEINRQFVADLSDGRVDLVDDGRTVIGTNSPAYTIDTFWLNQTVQTTQVARKSGSGNLAQSLVALNESRISLTLGGRESGTIDVRHFSDGTLRYDISVTTCPGRKLSYTFPNVQQKSLLNAISQDGKTYYKLTDTADPCAFRFEIPFDVAGTRLSWIDLSGEIVRATDGRYFTYVNGRWLPVSFDGPRLVQMLMSQGVVWGVSPVGELMRHDFEPGIGLPLDPATGGIRSLPGSAVKVALPASVKLIASSDDRRELFVLTSDNEVFWIDIRPPQGGRAVGSASRPVKLNLGNVCWISGGLIAVSCDGMWHRTVRAISDPSAPPVSRVVNEAGLTVVPGVKGLEISPIVNAVTPIWRSTDAFGIAAGTVTVATELSNTARLIGVDGSVRSLSGELISLAGKPLEPLQ